MAKEGTPVSIDAIVAAEQGRISHPVVEVFNRNEARIREISARHALCVVDDDVDERREFALREYAFLIDEIEDVGDFSLEPLDLIAIGARMYDLMSEHERSQVGVGIVAAYCLNGTDRSVWHRMPRHVFTTNSLPPSAVHDVDGVRRIYQNARHFEDIRTNRVMPLRPLGFTTDEMEEADKSFGDPEKFAQFMERLQNRQRKSSDIVFNAAENTGMGVAMVLEATRRVVDNLDVDYDKTLRLVEDIVAAENRQFTHPVLDVLDRNADRILQVYDEFLAGKAGEQTIDNLQKSYLFLTEELEEIGDFSLSPVDLFVIWSRVMEIMPSDYQRYVLALMVASAYCLKGIEDKAAWHNVPAHLVDTLRFPQTAQKDANGISIVTTNIEELKQSREDLREALNATYEYPFSKRPGIERTRNVMTVTLENFSNGMAPLINGAAHARLGISRA